MSSNHREEIAEAYTRAVAHHREGALESAEPLYRHILDLDPQHPGALHLLGFALHQRGRSAEAVPWIERALELSPDQPPYHTNFGLVLLGLGRDAEAESSFRRALSLAPDFAPALANLATLLSVRERWSDATAPLRRLVDLDPTNLDGRARLGAALVRAGELDEAARCFEAALHLDERSAELCSNLGSVEMARGRPRDAAALFERAAASRPDFFEAHYNLALARFATGELPEAELRAREATRLSSGSAEAHALLGRTLWRARRLSEARAACDRAVALDPRSAEARTALGCVLKDLALADDAIASFAAALALSPDALHAHSNLIFALSYKRDHDAAAIARETRLWNERHARRIAPSPLPHAADRDPGRRLRIGYVSANLRTHPHGLFLAPVLEAHDRRGFEIHCYSDLAKGDALTARLRAQADAWHETECFDDAALSERIRADGIDILVDLSRHTAGSRLLAFARRPAPVQVTWMGGPVATSGLDAMDYLIADDWHAPPGTDHLFTEEVVRLPGDYICYAPPPYAPPVAPPPSESKGHVTFGSFNNLAKLNTRVLACWAAILRAVPGSRLCLRERGLEDRETRERLLAELASEGVTADRIDLHGGALHRDFMAAYGDLDVALDPFPYSGGLTTCEALWMGVPVVSLRSSALSIRHSTSHLENAGLGCWLAADEAEYVALAVRLASDRDGLAQHRRTLRESVGASPLCDAKGFTRGLERAYRRLWTRFCEARSAAPRVPDSPPHGLLPSEPRAAPGVIAPMLVDRIMPPTAAPKGRARLAGRRPRVLVAVQEFPQVSETYIASELDALWDRYDVRVLTFNAADIAYRDHRPFTHLPLFHADPAVVQRRLRDIAAFVTDFAPDVIHGHYLHMASVLFGLSEMARAPFTLRAHSFDVLGNSTAKLPDYAEVLNHEACLGVLTFPFTVPLLAGAGIRADKLHACHPVVAFDRFHDETPNGSGVMNVGACIPKKNMEGYLRLATSMPQKRFDLYAVGYAIDSIRRLNAELGAPVHIADPVEPSDMPRHYKSHEWLVYTASDVERNVGWPRAVAEAQASGTGVCMQNIRPDLRDYVGDAGFLFDTLEEAADIVSRPFPEAMRRSAFEHARRSDVRSHIHLLEDLWSTAL